MALRNLIQRSEPAQEIDYLVGYGEEAVGDRYNRGGGNMAKTIGQLCGCERATGSDVKAFCCAPIHGLMMAAGLVTSRVFRNVVMVAGGSLAKLGMKFQGHLRKDMPILEDVLAGIAVWIAPDDGKSPVIRLDSIGKHEIGSGSAQQAILEKLVVEPLERLGLKLTQVDKYATELHNPEVTEPQGSGNVPRTNYRTIGSLAVLRNEIRKDELDEFVRIHGMPGFSPTQGHIAYSSMDDVGDRLDPPVRVPGEPLQVVGRIVRMEVIKHEKRVELGDLVVAKGPFQMDARSLDGWFAFPDFADLAYGFHLSLLS